MKVTRRGPVQGDYCVVPAPPHSSHGSIHEPNPMRCRPEPLQTNHSEDRSVFLSLSQPLGRSGLDIRAVSSMHRRPQATWQQDKKLLLLTPERALIEVSQDVRRVDLRAKYGGLRKAKAQCEPAREVVGAGPCDAAFSPQRANAGHTSVDAKRTDPRRGGVRSVARRSKAKRRVPNE